MIFNQNRLFEVLNIAPSAQLFLFSEVLLGFRLNFISIVYIKGQAGAFYFVPLDPLTDYSVNFALSEPLTQLYEKRLSYININVM
jgi:hypothetical protein